MKLDKMNPGRRDIKELWYFFVVDPKTVQISYCSLLLHNIATLQATFSKIGQKLSVFLVTTILAIT